MSRPVYAPRGAQEARGTGYAVRGFLPAPFSPSPSPAHQCVARAADAASRGCGGRRCAPIAAGGTRFKSSSRGLPPRSPDSTPVCAISMSSSLDVGSPRSPSGIPVVARPGQSSPQLSTVRYRRNRSWPLPRRRHARHRLDEGVRQSRPGHPGVGRFGSCFPRRSPEDRTAAAAFPRRLAWDTVGGPSAAPHRISRILSGTDVESIPPFLGFLVLRLFSPAGDGTGDVFLLLV